MLSFLFHHHMTAQSESRKIFISFNTIYSITIYVFLSNMFLKSQIRKFLRLGGDLPQMWHFTNLHLSLRFEGPIYSYIYFLTNYPFYRSSLRRQSRGHQNGQGSPNYKVWMKVFSYFKTKQLV